MNETTAAQEIANTDDDDEKLKLQQFFHDINEDLNANANDTCSAGKVSQKHAYAEESLDDEDEY